MKSCVVFAVTIFDDNKLHVLSEYLNVFKQNFNDSDFYIGINHGSTLKVEELIHSYQLSTNMSRVSEHMYCESDASAYQIALKTLKKSKKEYDIYWFAHTKGGVNHRPWERNLYLTEMFSKRAEIESIFNEHKYIGSYALRGVSGGAAGDNWAFFNRDHVIEICSNVATDFLPFSHVNWSYIETMYVINKQSIKTFFSIADEDFFDTKIKDRWYFETIFPWISTRCGFFPYIKQSGCFFNNSISLKNITAKWISDNNLFHLVDYLNL